MYGYVSKRPYSERMSLLCLVHCSQNRLVNPVEKYIFYIYLLIFFLLSDKKKSYVIL